MLPAGGAMLLTPSDMLLRRQRKREMLAGEANAAACWRDPEMLLLMCRCLATLCASDVGCCWRCFYADANGPEKRCR
jgi:hypothetical protein